MLGAAVSGGSQYALDAALRRFIPGGSATLRGAIAVSGNLGSGLGATKVGEKIDSALGIKAPNRKLGWGEIAGNFAGGFAGGAAGAALGTGVAPLAGTIAGGAAGAVAGGEIGAVAGRFIDRYGAKYAGKIQRAFFSSKPQGRQANA